MFETLRDDVRTALARDPAATSAAAVVCTYPGLHAVWLYRLAHVLWAHDHNFAARLVSHLCRLLTGVEIHPGAEVGDRLFIDHGMGTVVDDVAPETTVVGNPARPIDADESEPEKVQTAAVTDGS